MDIEILTPADGDKVCMNFACEKKTTCDVSGVLLTKHEISIRLAADRTFLPDWNKYGICEHYESGEL